MSESSLINNVEMSNYNYDLEKGPLIPEKVSTADIPLPAENATATEIRSYFTFILHQSYNIPELEARGFAAAWQAGTGRELRKYPAKLYLEVFGPQIGWILCKEVKTMVYKEDDVKYPQRSGQTTIALLVMSLVIAGILIRGGFMLIKSPDLGAPVVVGTGLVEIGFLLYLLCTCGRAEPETRAEGDLRTIWSPHQCPCKK